MSDNAERYVSECLATSHDAIHASVMAQMGNVQVGSVPAHDMTHTIRVSDKRTRHIVVYHYVGRWARQMQDAGKDVPCACILVAGAKDKKHAGRVALEWMSSSRDYAWVGCIGYTYSIPNARQAVIVRRFYTFNVPATA